MGKGTLAALAAVTVCIGLAVAAAFTVTDSTLGAGLLDGALGFTILGGVVLLTGRRERPVALVGRATTAAVPAAASRPDPRDRLLDFNERPPAAPPPGLLERLWRRQPAVRDEREVIVPAGVRS